MPCMTAAEPLRAPSHLRVAPTPSVPERGCARPGCSDAASATLVFRYQERLAWVEPLTDRTHPATYDLCEQHAERTAPPYGWAFEDRRRASSPRRWEHGDGSDPTVTVLGSVLHAPSGPPPRPSTDDPDRSPHVAPASDW